MELCSTDDKFVCLLATRVSAIAWLAAWASIFPYVYMGDRAFANKSVTSHGMWPISKESVFNVC